MALICNRHSFEYAENVCSKCGIAFCHDCLVYPRGPKKPPLCVPCAIAAAGVRSSARNQSNLSRREVKKRVREAKGLQQPQPYVEAPAAANTDRDFELTSNASFDQGWAVSWDEGRDPHPGIPRTGPRDLGQRSVRDAAMRPRRTGRRRSRGAGPGTRRRRAGPCVRRRARTPPAPPRPRRPPPPPPAWPRRPNRPRRRGPNCRACNP